MAKMSFPYMSPLFRQFIKSVIFLFISGLVVVPLGSVLLFRWFSPDTEPTPPAPTKAFNLLTGWGLPPSAKILQLENHQTNLIYDADFILKIQTSSDRIEYWLKESNQEEWQICPVPEAQLTAMRRAPGYLAAKQSIDDGELYRADTDEKLKYGTIVIINRQSKTVCVYYWKKERL